MQASAGSDTARQRTEARLDSRRVHTDEDGVKYFFLDEAKEAGRRNICDMRRFEFDFDNLTHHGDGEGFILRQRPNHIIPYYGGLLCILSEVDVICAGYGICSMADIGDP